MDRPASRSLAAVAVAAGLLSRAAWAQGAAPAPPLDDAALQKLLDSGFTDSAKVSMVMLPATVTDRRGRFVQGLTRDDFRVYENQVRQDIQVFNQAASASLSLAFLLDLSGSMRFQGKLARAKEAIHVLVGALGPRDRVALIGFADAQVAWITDFDQDRRTFLRRLDVQEGYGQTALNDAVAAAPSLLDAGGAGRKAIILFTDGSDNFSRYTTAQALELARRVNVPIYSIGFSSTPQELLPKVDSGTQLSILREISETTGGRLFVVDDALDLTAAISALDAELRHQYLIGYTPRPDARAGEFKALRVEVRQRWLDVRSRSGYVVTP